MEFFPRKDANPVPVDTDDKDSKNLVTKVFCLKNGSSGFFCCPKYKLFCPIVTWRNFDLNCAARKAASSIQSAKTPQPVVRALPYGVPSVEHNAVRYFPAKAVRRRGKSRTATQPSVGSKRVAEMRGANPQAGQRGRRGGKIAGSDAALCRQQKGG